jgi:DNA-binding protein H-NS
MSTYRELQGQIEKLQKEAELARKNELSNAIADIQSKMREFSISAEDLGLA